MKKEEIKTLNDIFNWMKEENEELLRHTKRNFPHKGYVNRDKCLLLTLKLALKKAYDLGMKESDELNKTN